MYVLPHMINEVMSVKSNVSTPSVGMLGTYHVGSDRYAVVVAKVISPKKIFVLDLNAEDLAGATTDADGVQWLSKEFVERKLKDATPWLPYYKAHYGDNANLCFKADFERFNEEGTFTFRKNGRWVREGHGLWECGAIHLGVADPYRDPSF